MTPEAEHCELYRSPLSGLVYHIANNFSIPTHVENRTHVF